MIESLKRRYQQATQNPEWKFPYIEKFFQEHIYPGLEEASGRGLQVCHFPNLEAEYPDPVNEVEFTGAELLMFLKRQKLQAKINHGILEVSGWAE